MRFAPQHRNECTTLLLERTRTLSKIHPATSRNDAKISNDGSGMGERERESGARNSGHDRKKLCQTFKESSKKVNETLFIMTWNRT